MAYRDFKDLPRRTASDKALRYELLNIAKYSNVADINEGLLQLLLKVLKKSHQVVVLKVN